MTTNDPPSNAPRAAAASAARGSLLLGVAGAWALLIGGYAVVIGIFSAASNPGDATAMLLVALPWLAMVGLIVWFAANGRPRSAIGVLIGMGSIFAVALLLVAACFGLLSTGGGWH